MKNNFIKEANTKKIYELDTTDDVSYAKDQWR